MAASLITVLSVFLVGNLLDPGGIAGSAGALIFSITPIFAARGTSTYAEPVSNMLVVTCLLICLSLLRPFVEYSRSAICVTWLALTFTSLLAIVVKRENLVITPLVLLVSILFKIDSKSSDARNRRLQYCALLATISVCLLFAVTQLRLLAVVRREQAEYAMFPFSMEIWRTMIPLFLRGYLSLTSYMGSALLVLIAILASLTSQRRCLYVVALFASFLLLYGSHVRSYYQLHNGPVTELDTIRYSMNLAGLWSIMAGVGVSTLVARFLRNRPVGWVKPWARRLTWASLASLFICSWIVTDRMKEDLVVNEAEVRLRPAAAALETIHRVGNPDTFIVTAEPLVVQMVAHEPVNVIDFKDFSTGLVEELRGENPNATFFYLEEDIHNSQADRERYSRSFGCMDEAHKVLLLHRDNYSIFEIL
jgi:hypothetical protein